MNDKILNTLLYVALISFIVNQILDICIKAMN